MYKYKINKRNVNAWLIDWCLMPSWTVFHVNTYTNIMWWSTIPAKTNNYISWTPIFPPASTCLGTAISVHMFETLNRYLVCVICNCKFSFNIIKTEKICNCFGQIWTMFLNCQVCKWVIFVIACHRRHLVCVIWNCNSFPSTLFKHCTLMHTHCKF